MKHEHLTEEIQTLGALYALGELDLEETRKFEAHLKEGCPPCADETHAFEAIVHQLALGLPPIAPRPQVKEQLLARIRCEATGQGASADPQVWKAWSSTPAQARWVIRSTEGDWQETGIEGVTVKNLFVDEVRHYVTMLVQMAPGSQYPSHRHAGAEECYVIQGKMRIGDQWYKAGDYIRNSPDSIDEDTYTENGCLLLISSSQQDELLAHIDSDEVIE